MLALLAPASAVASTPTDEAAGAPPRSEQTGSPADLAALIIGMRLGDESRASQPVSPLAAAADYGTAINGFGDERGRPHEGQDIFAPAGTPVVSPTATEVLETGSDGGRGNWAALWDPAAGRTYVFMHMERPAGVVRGERLDPGERVGLLGCTGSCDGPHLHFEIRAGRGPYAPPIDPLPTLRRWQPAG